VFFEITVKGEESLAAKKNRSSNSECAPVSKLGCSIRGLCSFLRDGRFQEGAKTKSPLSEESLRTRTVHKGHPRVYYICGNQKKRDQQH